MNNRVISEYLESLKEDDELDYIFPILLESMGFQIVSTPKNSKGQSQYGKDVIAIGKDESGRKCKWYFELKGNAAKDINDHTFNCHDGVRESILAAKDVEFKDSSIPDLGSLPTKVVFVHNGILQENTRVQFHALIKREFPNNNFERWGIEKLTDLFSKHLFDECLYRDEQSYRLVKRILVMYDAPGWDVSEFEKLVDIQLSYCPSNRSQPRLLSKCFSSISLMLAILLKEGQRINNFMPAKRASDIAVLKVWAWILKNNKTSNQKILSLFGKLVNLHLHIYAEYLDKLIPLATQYKGLYMVDGLHSENVLYPLRCFDFISDLVYYHFAFREYLPCEKQQKFDQSGIELVLRIISCNSGFDIPLLDTHSIPILLVIKYVMTIQQPTEELHTKIGEWIIRMVVNVLIRKQDSNMFPELYGSRRELAKSVFVKSPNYHDESSLLLTILAELLHWINADELYKKLYELVIKEDTNLQVSYPIELPDLEILLFSKRLYNEMAVETSISLPKELKELPQYLKKDYTPIKLKTDRTPYHFLKYLTHIHYQTDWFPDFADFGFVSSEKNKNRSKTEK
ncbi:hypothetical protein [Odoribacter lunatus]|uniref:hypothetical protein n=1 Tax=Odoribacter lunatus TaxID=2941335 RepID=UPI0020422BA8|nr:hypothetical protein [Odoribacter lunatus]